MKKILLSLVFCLAIVSCGGGGDSAPAASSHWRMHSAGEWWVESRTPAITGDELIPDTRYALAWGNFGVEDIGNEPMATTIVDVTRLMSGADFCSSGADAAGGCTNGEAINPVTQTTYDLISCQWGLDVNGWVSFEASVATVPADADCDIYRYHTHPEVDDLMYAGTSSGNTIGWFAAEVVNWNDNTRPGDNWAFCVDAGGSSDICWQWKIQSSATVNTFMGDDYDTWFALNSAPGNNDCAEVRSVTRELGPLVSIRRNSYLGDWGNGTECHQSDWPTAYY